MVDIHSMTAKEIHELIESKLMNNLVVSPVTASNAQFYKATALVIRDIMSKRRKAFVAENNARGQKQVYYLSMEFLMGKSLKNTLYNTGMVDVFREALAMDKVKLEDLYSEEPDPGLGNGGLGRLAACYLDGLATDGYYATGYSILYEYGIFKQKISEGWQTEMPDYWLPGGEVWLEPVPEHSQEVHFGGTIQERVEDGRYLNVHTGYSTVKAVPYNMYVSGYDTNAVSMLRLWKAERPGIDMDKFNRGDYMGAFGDNSYAEAISKVLYPNDNHSEGKLLRLRQQYFLSAAAIGDIFRRHMSNYGTIDNFAEKTAIHINDTHPTLAIPELMRVLMDECGYSWERSWEVVQGTFCYTNHTVLAEALEKWNTEQMRQLLPRIFQIICEINRRFCIELREVYHKSEDEIKRMCIVYGTEVRMANLCVAACHSVNGVAKLHSEIIKDDLFHDFYTCTPEKFKNVTNGIASRRWLMQSNPRLNQFIIEHIGDGFLHDFSQLAYLNKLSGDETALRRLAQIKDENKVDFSNFLKEERGILVNPHSIFDVQVKRLHEYKRQQLNAMNILNDYLTLVDNPNCSFVPKTYIFGAKAAPGYFRAKQIIKFICDLGELIDKTPACKDRLKIVFLEEYNVTMSELLMPASEISEQISLAGKEASGTGNMKQMLNGALTMGTMDGANVEIHEAVGSENIFIFGMRTPEVNAIAKSYHPGIYLQRSPRAKALLDRMLSLSDRYPSFKSMYDYLMNQDPYMAIADYDSYCDAQKRAEEIYGSDNLRWQRMSLANIAGSGIFCADRSIEDYARDIWHLNK